MSAASTSKNPTLDFYGHLDDAFVFFNDRLFDGALPKIMFELTNKKQVAGLFKAASWQATDGVYVHSIAINPQIIVQSTPLVIYITLVKEMVHLWQKTYGEASRPGYHNTEWGDKMESIGLMPSSTGLPGGKKVGQKMSSYLIAGGAFEAAAVDFFLEGNFINLVDATIDDADVLKLRNQLLLECVKKNQSLTEYYEGWQSKAIGYDAARQPSEVLKIDVDDYDHDHGIENDDDKDADKDFEQDSIKPSVSKKAENVPLEPKDTPKSAPKTDRDDSLTSLKKADASDASNASDFNIIDATSFTDDIDHHIDGYDNYSSENIGIYSGEYSHEDELDDDILPTDDVLALGNGVVEDLTSKHVFEDALSHLVTEPLKDMTDIVGVPDTKPKYDFNKTKYQCPTCKSNLWGKPSMNILCVDCDSIFDVAN
ncbi:hypothetical protein [Psychrobacter sp. UBA3480]|uniref:hypothetical protein n=1 Tax=Psychrobacter sp. UBA3480 TaxID=1947350 RepID=UPI0025E81FB1|nr:hypothetical protein [Psychrobacter sp. UBA3480]